MGFVPPRTRKNARSKAREVQLEREAGERTKAFFERLAREREPFNELEVNRYTSLRLLKWGTDRGLIQLDDVRVSFGDVRII